jgi:hypothetical protein
MSSVQLASASSATPLSSASSAATVSRAILHNFSMDQELALATEVVDGEIKIEVSVFANARSMKRGI